MPVYYNGEKVTNALPITKLQSKIVTENETTVTPDIGYNGLSSVTVNVPTGDYNINSEILEDGTQRMIISSADNNYIQMPDAFRDAQHIYHFNFDNDIVLVSGDGSPYTQELGVWEYRRSTNTFNQVFNKSENFNYFQKLGNYCLINTGNANGHLVLYDGLNHEASSLLRVTSDNRLYYYNNFIPITEDLCYIRTIPSGYKYLKVNLNTKTAEFTDNYYRGASNNIYPKAVNKYILFNDSTNGLGAIDTDNDSTHIFTTLNMAQSIITGYNNYFIVPSKSTDNAGIYLGNLNDNTFELIVEDYVYSYTPTTLAINNGYIFYSSHINNTDLLHIYPETKEVKKIEIGVKPQRMFYCKDRVLIGGQSGSLGLIKYNTLDNTYTTTSVTTFNWSFDEVKEGVLINTSNGGGYGIYFYNFKTDLISQIYTNGDTWTSIISIPEGYFMSCYNSSNNNSGGWGVLYFNPNTLEVTLLCSSGANLNKCITITDGYRLSSTNTSFPYVIDVDMKTLTGKLVSYKFN